MKEKAEFDELYEKFKKWYCSKYSDVPNRTTLQLFWEFINVPEIKEDKHHPFDYLHRWDE